MEFGLAGVVYLSEWQMEGEGTNLYETVGARFRPGQRVKVGEGTGTLDVLLSRTPGGPVGPIWGVIPDAHPDTPVPLGEAQMEPITD